MSITSAFCKYARKGGIEEDEDISLHAVFTGNPGTGKTTVVKVLGKIYHAIGLLSKGHVHTVEASDLVSGFVRQTGTDTKKAIKKARGGILFIDEAYMLFKADGGNDFGPEAVAALITEMSDGEGDIAIMVAGYPKEMEAFINSNPGLKSRFRNHFHFEDYTPEELVKIAEFSASELEVTLSAAAKKQIKKAVTRAFRKRDRTFGNARFAHAMVDEAKMNLGIRLMKTQVPETLTKKQLSEIQEEDIEDLGVSKDTKNLKLPIDRELLKEAQGGILFIDEAYALTEGRNDGFGKKAVATLIKQMEDKRKEFGLIVAGYPENMEAFLESNPGLKSRFDHHFKFEDFSEEDLFTIALRMLADKSLKPDKEASEHIRSYLAALYAGRDKFFGNARSVRKMVEKSHRNQELRMASLPKEKRTPAAIGTLVLAW